MTPAERLALLEAGQNELCVTKLKSGFLVLSDEGYLPGYCLLLASPLAYSLEKLPAPERSRFLEDMGNAGEKIQLVTGCKRVNYGILGNVDPFLHVHFWPRYEWEEHPYSTLPPLAWPAERRAAEVQRHQTGHAGYLAKLKAAFSETP
jgi:diadenosine tetraphosphate (Ap4A) HIT family hydrolase